MAKGNERTEIGLPLIEPRFRAHPQRSGAVESQRVDMVVDQRVRIRRVVAQVLDVSRRGLENVDARIAGSHPDPATGIDEHVVHGIAGKRGGVRRIVAINGKAVRRPVPAGEACVLDRNPKIVMRVLDDLIDEISRQPSSRTMRVGIADQFVPIVADQAVFRAQPDETLRILQGRKRRCPAAGRRRWSDARERAAGHRQRPGRATPRPGIAKPPAGVDTDPLRQYSKAGGLHPCSCSLAYDARERPRIR